MTNDNNGFKRLNLALQGGGTHGAFTWGVLHRLAEEPRLKVDGISGTSAGSVNAVLFAEGWRKTGAEGAQRLLHDFWLGVSQYSGDIIAGTGLKNPLDEGLFRSLDVGFSTWFEMVGHVFSPAQMNPFNLNPLKELLERFIDFEQLNLHAPFKLFVGATNVRTGRIKVFDNMEICSDAILASCCLPKLYRSVEVHGEHYWDGGYMGNPPIFPLYYNTRTEDFLIVHVNPIYRDTIPKCAVEIDNRINEISFNSSLMHEIRAIEFAKKLVKDEWLKPEYREHFRFDDLRLHTLASQNYLNQLTASSKFNTHWYFLTSLFEMGKECMNNWIEAHYDDIGIRQTIDLKEMYL